MITRTEISDNVKRDLVRIWKEENKFILLISDKDLIDMITLKEDDNEPEKIIEKLIFDFRRSLDLFKNISFFCFTQNYLGKIQNKQGIP